MRARGQKTGWNQCQEQDSGSQVSLVTQRAISRKVHQLSPSKTRGSLSFHFECEYRVRQCQEIPTGRNTPEPKEIKKGFSTMGNPRTVLERRECRQRMRARRSADKENSPTLTPPRANPRRGSSVGSEEQVGQFLTLLHALCAISVYMLGSLFRTGPGRDQSSGPFCSMTLKRGQTQPADSPK